MAVPRSRISNARKNIRRSHHAKSPKVFSTCSKCGQAHLPHTICASCGSYGGRVVTQPADASSE